MHHANTSDPDREVEDRLRGMSALADHLARGELTRVQVVDMSQEMLNYARGWCIE